MEQKEITKTRLIIYVLMAYGLTYLMGILMWYEVLNCSCNIPT